MIKCQGIKGYLEGTFDLFHIGHLNYIKLAKSKCDYLVVGVYNDDVVKSYKMHTPVIPFDERVKIIDSLKYVDHVKELNYRDKIKAFNEISFDILFMSTDWKYSSEYTNIEGVMMPFNVTVEWLPYSKGISTSLIIQRIIEDYNDLSNY